MFRTPKRCPAFGQTCRNCGKRNRSVKNCRSRQENTSVSKQAHEVHAEEHPDNPGDYGFNLDIVETTRTLRNAKGNKFAVVRVNTPQHKGLRLKAKVDTGARANILNCSTYRALFGPHHNLKPSSVRLTGYGNRAIKNLGAATAHSIQHGNRKLSNVIFLVTETGNNVFGLDLCTKLGIVQFSCDERQECCATYDIEENNARCPMKKEEIIQENEDIFTGIGKIAKEYHIELTSEVAPVIKPARRTPDALKQPLRQQLNRLLDLGIIRELREPTEWVNDIVLVTKPDGSLRLCLDPLESNKYIKRPHYYAKKHSMISYQS